MNEKDYIPIIVYLVLLVIGLVVFPYKGCTYETQPTAMDVYQGKTTLEITYKDGVAIDSVVVYKGKEK